MTSFKSTQSLFDLIDQHRFSKNVALQHMEDDITYSELCDYSVNFSSYLTVNGIKKNDRIILLLDNSLEYVITLFGVLGVGAVAIPINPNSTQKEIFHFYQKSQATGFITRHSILKRVGIDTQTLLPLVLFKQNYKENVINYFQSNSHNQNKPCDVSLSDLAMIIFTSGTTGHPKGVMLSHKNILANTYSIIKYLHLTHNDSIVNVLPFFYSFGGSILMTHIAAGGKIFIENRFMFPSKVIETLQQFRPTGFSGVPSTFYILLKKTNFLDCDWGFLRYISQAGGGIRTETIKTLSNTLQETEIYIMYGQTEASARLSFLDPSMIKKKCGSIGTGMPGVELRVVNEQGDDIKPGEVGEIIARGDNVMQGYLDDQQATKDTIRDGWLYTGDIARCDEDGYIYIINRKKDFIKSASYRISPSEIEEVLAHCEGVIDVAVIGIEDELLGEAIAACIDCAKEIFNEEVFRGYCKSRLPSYKVPQHYIHEQKRPYTASGKKRYNVLREKYKYFKSQGVFING